MGPAESPGVEATCTPTAASVTASKPTSRSRPPHAPRAPRHYQRATPRTDARSEPSRGCVPVDSYPCSVRLFPDAALPGKSSADAPMIYSSRPTRGSARRQPDVCWPVPLRCLGLRAYVSIANASGSPPGRSAITAQWLRRFGVALPVARCIGGRTAITATLRTLAVASRLDGVGAGGGPDGASSWEIAWDGPSFEARPPCALGVTSSSPRRCRSEFIRARFGSGQHVAETVYEGDPRRAPRATP